MGLGCCCLDVKKRYYPLDQYSHAQNQAGYGYSRALAMVPIVHVRLWARLFWVTACTCGRYRSRHLTHDGALRAAEIHEVSHVFHTRS